MHKRKLTFDVSFKVRRIFVIRISFDEFVIVSTSSNPEDCFGYSLTDLAGRGIKGR